MISYLPVTDSLTVFSAVFILQFGGYKCNMVSVCAFPLLTSLRIIDEIFRQLQREDD